MEHYLFVSDISVVVLTVIESCEDGMILFGIFDQAVFFFVLIGAIEDDVMLALKSVLVPLHVANQHKLRILRCVDVAPLFCQQRLRFFLH